MALLKSSFFREDLQIDFLWMQCNENLLKFIGT